MLDYITYEFKKQTDHFKGLIYTNVITNFLSFLFFTLVGQLDTSDINSILRNPIGIMTLSITLTVSVSIVYSVVIFNRLLVRYYIKNTREMTYLFPGGRTTIFSSKLYALCSHFLLSLSPIILENIMFYAIGDRFNFVKANFFEFLLKDMPIVVFSGFFSLVLILLSIFIGIFLQSTNSALVSAVIAVSIIGNLIAQLYQINNLLIVIFLLIVLFLDLMLIKLLMIRVKDDDIIYDTYKKI